jgi:hypothetical protein
MWKIYLLQFIITVIVSLTWAHLIENSKDVLEDDELF